MSDLPQKPDMAEGGRKPNNSVPLEEYVNVGRLFAQGWSYRRLGRKYDVDEGTIRRVLQNHVWPAARLSPSRAIEVELTKIDAVEKCAWKAIENEKKPDIAYLKIILDCSKERSKLEGHYAAKKIRLETTEEFRVAGQTPDAVAITLVEELLSRVDEIKKREAIIRGDVVEGQLINPPPDAAA